MPLHHNKSLHGTYTAYEYLSTKYYAHFYVRNAFVTSIHFINYECVGHYNSHYAVHTVARTFPILRRVGQKLGFSNEHISGPTRFSLLFKTQQIGLYKYP